MNDIDLLIQGALVPANQNQPLNLLPMRADMVYNLPPPPPPPNYVHMNQLHLGATVVPHTTTQPPPPPNPTNVVANPIPPDETEIGVTLEELPNPQEWATDEIEGNILL